MIKINIIAVGKLKNDLLRPAADEYIKRLSRYCKITETEIEPERLKDDPKSAEIALSLEKEGERILSKIPERGFAVALCVEGEKLSSEALSRKIISSAQNAGEICFIIGGSNGLCERVKARADLRLSMSDMTFPHKLARVMLLEQIYRAFKIDEGSAYHK